MMFRKKLNAITLLLCVVGLFVGFAKIAEDGIALFALHTCEELRRKAFNCYGKTSKMCESLLSSYLHQLNFLEVLLYDFELVLKTSGRELRNLEIKKQQVAYYFSTNFLLFKEIFLDD